MGVWDAAWTDAVLASVAWGGAGWLALRVPGRRLPAAGLAIVALAASVGTARFAGAEALIPAHQALSGWAGLVGVPLVALGVVALPLERATRALVEAVVAVVALALTGVLVVGGLDLADRLEVPVTGACLVASIGAGGFARNWVGVCGAALVLVAGLGVAGPGAWLGFDREGWFHLVFALALGCLVAALRPDRGTPVAPVAPPAG